MDQGHFTAPAKRLRVRAGGSHRPATSRTVSSSATEEPFHPQSAGHAACRRSALGKVNMHSEPALSPPVSPVAGIDRPTTRSADEAAAGPAAPPPSSRGRQPARFARSVMSALRGDKYMAGAYPPEWTASSTRADAGPHGVGTATPAADAVSATPSQGR
jgi:hypothetical protein